MRAWTVEDVPTAHRVGYIHASPFKSLPALGEIPDRKKYQTALGQWVMSEVRFVQSVQPAGSRVGPAGGACGLQASSRYALYSLMRRTEASRSWIDVMENAWYFFQRASLYRIQHAFAACSCTCRLIAITLTRQGPSTVPHH